MPKLCKMLGAVDAPYIISLMRLIETQSKVTMAGWCMNYCEEHILPIFERYCPGDSRPRHAIAAAWKLDNNLAAQAAARACG